MPLDLEMTVFGEHLADWLRSYPGKFVLIHGAEFSFFDTDEAAYEHAVDRYGDADVLIRQVLPQEARDGSFALFYGLVDAIAAR